MYSILGKMEPLKTWAKQLKRDTVMLWFAKNHPDTPLLAKLICIVAVAYALSPIDLIPDFIPVLGYIDDLLIVPGLIWLAIRMLPPVVVLRCRTQAEVWLASRGSKPKSYAGAAFIIALWGLLTYAIYRWATSPI